jgi:4-hydroxy-3-polyprenylbenzoate decarboxylase
MPYRDLREFLADLESRGELRRVRAEVDPRLEITEICDRVVKRGGPALFFERPRGSSLPVAVNLFGTARRMAMALGAASLEEVAGRLRELLDLAKARPKGLVGALGLLPRLAELASYPPRRVSRAPVQEVVLRGDDVDLSALPVLTCWPGDAGPFITLPQVITRDPETGERNVGMYRLQVHDRRTLGLHWQRHKGGAHQYRRASGGGRRLEVAVALGGDPATMYAASAPLPEGIDEFVFAGFLRRQGVEVVRGVTVDLEVPAHAEIVIEGYTDPGEPLRREGPFGDHTGFYSLPDDYPVLHVTAITRRRDAIYPTIVVGRPIQEDYWLGHATERIFLPLVQTVLPEVVDLHMPPEGIFHNLVFVAIEKRYPGHAYKVAHALWGLGLMMLSKVIVVVDAWVDVRDPATAWWAALNNLDPERDVLVSRGPTDVLDHASRHFSYGGKLVLDGTGKWPEEGVTRPWPDPVAMSPEVRALVDRRWGEYGID